MAAESRESIFGRRRDCFALSRCNFATSPKRPTVIASSGIAKTAISPLAGRRRTGRRPRRKRRHSSQTVAAKLPGRTTRYSNEPCWRVEVHGCEQLAQSRRYAAAASWPAGDGTRDLVPSCRRPFISFISNGCEMVRFYLRPRQPPRHARRSRGDRGARADPTFSSTSNCSLIGGRAWRHLTALSLSLSAPRLSRRGIAITAIWIARLALTQTRDESEDGTSEPPGQRQGQGQTLLSLRYPPGPHL